MTTLIPKFDLKDGGATPTGAINRPINDKLAETVSVQDFGATGDGVTDDTAAIQAAINSFATTSSASATGGGTVFFPAGKYRITSTLLIGYGVTLQGLGAGGYPFIGSNAQISEIYADFGSTVNQWVIDSATYMTSGGARIAYNAWANASIDTDYNSLHNVAIKGLYIVDANASLQTNVPWGAVRLVGCPNAIISDVSILGFGIGVQLNTSFGTTVTNITSLNNYYGLVAYNANNNITVQGQFDQIVSPAQLTVPTGRIPSWMPTSADFTGTSFYMNGSHYQSSKGVTIAGTQAIGSNSSSINVITQYYQDSVFLYNSYANTIQNLYVEGSAVQNCISSAYASYSCTNLHNYTSNSSCVIDAGYQTIGEINVGGNNLSTIFARNIWGSKSPSDPTNVLVHNNSQGASISLVPRLNFLYYQAPWTPTVTAGSGTITTLGDVKGLYTLNGGLCTIQFDITITTNGTGAATVVIGNLPYAPAIYPTGYGVIATGSGINPGNNKALTIICSPSYYSADIFNYDGTYPGANSTRLVGTISYAISY